MSDSQPTASIVAVKLHDALQVVRSLDAILRPNNNVGIDTSPGDDKTDVNVHGCTPAQMDKSCLMFDGATANRDADDILRWVEVELEHVTLTFFRR